MYALVNCDIYTGDSVEYDKAILIEGEHIHGLVRIEELDDSVEQINLNGDSVAPGFIDVQVNGGGGVLFNDNPTPEGIAALVDAHKKYGTTNLLPTYITGSIEGMREAAGAINTYLNKSAKGVLGIHYEGPFINVAKAGVHDKKHIIQYDDAVCEVITSIDQGITLLTVAPEIVGTNIIRNLTRKNIIISLGHTNASYDEAISAFDAGATCTTHLYNAMSPLASRAPGVVGAALDHQDSWIGIIVDGYHVDFSSIRVAIRAKAHGKSILVTDSMPPLGTDKKGFVLGELNIQVDDGRCVTNDGVLAGSVLDMSAAVRNCIQKIGLPKDEALRMSSTYPSAFLGLENELGKIASGYRANLTIFNNQIYVKAVVVEGEFEHLK